MKYMITGPPGAGKTTVLEELHDRGFATVDADFAPGLAGWVDNITGDKVADWSAENPKCPPGCMWGWGLTEMRTMIDNPPGNPFFFGGQADRIEHFYPLFNKIFGLMLDEETNIQRVSSPRNNPHNYGAKPEHIDQTRIINRGFVEHAEQNGIILIDALQPVPTIADTILRLCDERS